MSNVELTQDFAKVASLGDLDPGSVVQVTIGNIDMALARTEEGDVYAVNDLCSHGNVSLSEGEVEGCMLECWLHGSRFDLRTGRPDCLPATEPIDTYVVKIEGDDVLVAIPSA